MSRAWSSAWLEHVRLEIWDDGVCPVLAVRFVGVYLSDGLLRTSFQSVTRPEQPDYFVDEALITFKLRTSGRQRSGEV